MWNVLEYRRSFKDLPIYSHAVQISNLVLLSSSMRRWSPDWTDPWPEFPHNNHYRTDEYRHNSTYDRPKMGGRNYSWDVFFPHTVVAVGRTWMLVCTCGNLTFSLHLPSTKSHVHISPFSDELTKKLLSSTMDARDKHKTGAVCPTNKHLGVIFNVSGFTFLK